MVYLIISLIILVTAIVLVVLISKKFSKLSSLDLGAMKQHKQKQIKVSIVEERLERKLGDLKEKIVTSSAPYRERVMNYLRDLYNKALKIAKEYREKENTNNALKQEDKESIRQNINSLITQAQELAEKEQYQEAEKKYIEAISLDKQNIEPYKGLGELYITKKDFEHAKETFEFIKEINPKDDVVWRQLGSVCNSLNKSDESIKCYKEAVDLAPNNPKNLDILLEMSIKAGDRFLAQTTIKKLEEVNPDNKKLDEYREQVEKL